MSFGFGFGFRALLGAFGPPPVGIPLTADDGSTQLTADDGATVLTQG